MSRWRRLQETRSNKRVLFHNFGGTGFFAQCIMISMCHLEMLRRTTLNAGSVLMLLVEKALSCETQQIGWACFKEGARASTKHHWEILSSSSWRGTESNASWEQGHLQFCWRLYNYSEMFYQLLLTASEKSYSDAEVVCGSGWWRESEQHDAHS